jgi:hypothetical protein
VGRIFLTVNFEFEWRSHRASQGADLCAAVACGIRF